MRCKVCNKKVTDRDSRGIIRSTHEGSCAKKARSQIGYNVHPVFRGDSGTGLRN